MKRIVIDIHEKYANMATFSFVGLSAEGARITTLAANIQEDDYFVVAGDGKITEHNSLAKEE